MRKPIIKTNEQLDKMTKTQFNNHRHTVNLAALTINDIKIKEYAEHLTRYALNRWYEGGK